MNLNEYFLKQKIKDLTIEHVVAWEIEKNGELNTLRQYYEMKDVVYKAVMILNGKYSEKSSYLSDVLPIIDDIITSISNSSNDRKIEFIKAEVQYRGRVNTLLRFFSIKESIYDAMFTLLKHNHNDEATNLSKVLPVINHIIESVRIYSS